MKLGNLLNLIRDWDSERGWFRKRGVMLRISRNEKFQILGIMISCLILFVTTVLPAKAADPLCPPGTYPIGTGCNLISLPEEGMWNGDLVIFAHGYVSPTIEMPVIVDYEIPPDNKTVSQILTGLGYAFATTSYSDNGLVIPHAVEDIKQLRDWFLEFSGLTPTNVYLIGVSEGGLVTALALEENPDLFSGGLAICGPAGNFSKQIHYFGDFLVLFNYFFPNFWKELEGRLEEVLGKQLDLGTPTPAGIPDVLVDQDIWDNVIAPAVLAAIHANPSAKRQLLRVANAPTDPDDPLSRETILGILWYGIFATNDAIDKLGGNPYENSRRWYSGSSGDLRLNRQVDRFLADADALRNIEYGLQTTGGLSSPLVTLHTTQDPIVPYWHETLYNLKTLFSGSLMHHLNIPVVRYGHCAFNRQELLTAFAILLFMSGGY